MLGTITLTVGQPDGVAQKEEAPETMDTIQDEVAPQVNGEKVEKESPDANEICAVEEKAAEVKPEDANEVGFKKIFRFVGFKFTLKKDKSEEKDPVKLLTIKDKEGEDVVGTEEPTKEEAVTNEEKSTAEEKEADTEAATAEAEVKDDNTETTDVPAEDAAAEDAAAEATAAEATAAEATAAEATDEAAKEEVAEKEGENTVSPFRKLFSGGLFSNLRKKASIKKTKEEENKEASAEEAAKTEEPAVEEKEEKDEVEQEAKEEAPTTPEEEKTETVPEAEVTAETPAAAAATTDETKPEKAEPSEEEKAPAEVTSEAELLSSQEKVKAQGSPLKKLFTGAGLKKLSTKKQKPKKDTETKLTESGEQAAETLQASTESTDAPKTDSEPSSPEEVEDNVAVGVTQNESDGEVASDGEKKKEGIIAWSSFKRLVTPKKRVKRPSESEDEAAAEKPAKSATLSSSESATLADKSVEEEAKEEKPTEEEPKTEDTEKLVSSTEEPKKKMDTSVSWEALMCMGGPKKRTRRTSDSDDEETKVEEESAPAVVEGEQEGKTEAAIVSSQTAESDGEIVSSSEPLSPQPERESTWDTLKRMVMPKNKAKAEEKPEEAAEPVVSDSEAPKDESSFSLRKLFPGRRKKKAEKQASTEQGEEDSDTPAVVPLSEYEDQAQVEQEAPAEPAEVQVKVSSEDRSPSWIPATVEDSDEKQLSDIPEEAENAATPKSVDTDIVEDETEDKSPVAPAGMGRRLSTAEVKPVAPTPSAETTPVPQGPKPDNAEEVIEGIQAEISEIPALAGVTVEDAPVEEVSVKTEYEPPTDTASTKTCAILEPHIKSEAMAICTGLGAKEIAKVATEKSAVPVLESMTEIRDALSTEVTVEDKEGTVEQATVDENAVLMIPQNHVEGTELEPVVETSHSDLSECIEAASESHEPKIETVGIVATVLEESEIIQPATTSENSPNGVRIIDSIAPISETAVCTQSLEVTEPIVQTKEMKMDVEQLAATESNTVNETVQYVPAEMASAICETTKSTIVKETEPTIPVIEPSEDVVISKTVVLVAPAASEAVCEETKLQAEETVEATIAQTAAVEISAAPELSSQDMEEMKEEVQETTEIEVQSMVIAQNVIQDAMDTVSEDVPAPQDPTTPTPVQAVATTEKEIEIPTESATISETPVAVCKPVSKLLHVATEVIPVPIPVEVTESLDEEKKPEEELKKAVEVKVSEETVVVEEVEEIKTVEEPEQVEEEESKEFTDVQEPDVKEAAEEVEPQSEEEKPEPPTEQNKEKVLEIHMPVQVVLQTAQVFEEPSVEEEAAEEFDCNGPAAKDDNVKVENKLSTVSEEVTASADVSTPSQVTEAEAPETPSGKCAEVMAQVIEVIEEAVKEIEPVSTEITAAS